MQWEQMSGFAQFRHRVVQHLWQDDVQGMDVHALNVTPEFEALIRRARAVNSTTESIALATILLSGIRDGERSDFNNMVSDIVYGESASNQDAESADDALAGDADQARPPSGPPDGEAQNSGASRQHSDVLIEATAQTPPPSSSQSGRSALARPVMSIPLSTAFDTVTDFTGKGNAAQWHKLRGIARSRTGSLKARLERALQAQAQVHWQREQERGDIDRASVAKLAMAPSYRTPFRQKRRAPTRDAAITLLIDLSGSMAGEKLTLARLCAAALTDALTDLEFDCEVLGYSSVEDPRMRALYEAHVAGGQSMGASGFNRYLEKLDLRVYKRFDSRNLNGLAAIECGHENPDGEALAWAADRLLAQRAKRRILLVLSDGYPATGEGHPLILKTDLLARVKRCEQAGIDLIGIGVLEDAVETFYPNNVVVRNLEDLPATVFEALQNILLNA
jgi:cobaltochelatase CobT